MKTQPETPLLTAEEFWLSPESPDGGKMELIDGVPVTHRPAGWAHGRIHGRVGSRILDFVEANSLGEVGISCGFVLARDPDVVRSPDVHFVQTRRLPHGGKIDEGFFFGAPDLAIEVIDHHDLDSLVIRKLGDYQRAGVPRVWVVRPDFRSVTVHFPDGTARRFEDGDTLTSHEAGLDVQGFALDVTELFGELMPAATKRGFSFATKPAAQPLNAEEFWLTPDPPDGGKMELIDGTSVSHPPATWAHGSAQVAVGYALHEFAKANKLGVLGYGCGFVLGRAPDVVRSPDVHFVRSSSLPANGRMAEGFFFGAPDLAVDVVDSHDPDSLVVRKVQDYQRAGVSRIWIIRLDTRSVTVHLLGSDPHTFHDGDILTSEDAGFEVDGFTLDVTELFGEP